jgi:hypothetical protein
MYLGYEVVDGLQYGEYGYMLRCQCNECGKEYLLTEDYKEPMNMEFCSVACEQEHHNEVNKNGINVD